MKESRYIELQATKHILLHDLSHILCNLLLKFENENSPKGLYIYLENKHIFALQGGGVRRLLRFILHSEHCKLSL